MTKMVHYLKLLNDMYACLKILGKKYKEARFHPVFLANCNYALEELSNPYNVKLHQLGELNKDRVIALIEFPGLWIKTAGFFALFNRTLCALSFCDRLNLTPIIENWANCAYEESIPVNGTKYVFEYYFESLTDISREQANKSFNVIKPTNLNMDLVLLEYKVDKWYSPSASYIKHMGEIWKKYIRLNEKVSKQMTLDIEGVLKGRRTLGVHFRGTDFKLNVNNHPVSISEEDYFYYIDEALDTGGFDQIFLATDDLLALKCFCRRYKNIVYYDDVYRANGNTSVAYSTDNRSLHKYRLGYEVIRDALTLGCCSGLIAGASQVNIASRIYKSSKQEEFVYFRLIDKGINKNSLEWIDYYQKHIGKDTLNEH